MSKLLFVNFIAVCSITLGSGGEPDSIFFKSLSIKSLFCDICLVRVQQQLTPTFSEQFKNKNKNK